MFDDFGRDTAEPSGYEIKRPRKERQRAQLLVPEVDSFERGYEPLATPVDNLLRAVIIDFGENPFGIRFCLVAVGSDNNAIRRMSVSDRFGCAKSSNTLKR